MGFPVGNQPQHRTKPEREALRKLGYRKCGKCGKVISARALACRRCGKRQRVNPRTLMLGLACLGMVGMFAVAVIGALMSPSRASELAPGALPSPAAAAASGREPVRVTAAGLIAAYQRDPAGADRQYKEKRVAVTGQVVAVPTRDFQGNVLLRLGAGDVMETVRVTVASRSSSLAVSLSKGQTVSLICTARGALIGAPILGDCLL
jgi:hypothetical protein